MVDKEEIIEILKRHPSGLKAKDIAILICGADRKTVNQILYANPSSFSCNANYEWTLLSKTAPVMQKTPKPIVAVDSARRIDREVSQDYKNYYLAIDRSLSQRNLRQTPQEN